MLITTGLDHLQLGLYDFTLRATGPMTLPGSKGNLLRGGFGITFKRTVCVYPGLPPCADCLLRHNCAYPAIFEPTPPPDTEVLRNQNEVPLPFVIEPPLDDGTEYTTGETLTFRLVLIGRGITALPYFIVVFQRLGENGLGPVRARYTLEEVAFYAPNSGRHTPVLTQGRLVATAREQAIAAPMLMSDAPPQSVNTLTLHFQTPTRLKYADDFLHTAPPFHVVIRTLLRRVSSLSYFHAGQRWDTDYRGWIERAEQITIAQADIHWADWERYSTRQERHIHLGGIVGQVTYTGEIAGFLPLLRLGKLIHVGKGAVFGNGQYVCQV